MISVIVKGINPKIEAVIAINLRGYEFCELPNGQPIKAKLSGNLNRSWNFIKTRTGIREANKLESYLFRD